MGVGFDLLKALIILLPGFLTLKIVEDLAYTRSFKTDLERVIQGLVYTFIDNSLFLMFLILIHKWGPISSLLEQLEYYTATSIKMGPPSPLPTLLPLFVVVIGLFVTSIVTGLVIARSSNNGKLFRFFNRWRFSPKTGRPTAWADTFIETPENTYIAVNFVDGRRLIGLPGFFPDDPEEGNLFVTDAQWVEVVEDYNFDPPTSQITMRPIPGPGILITKNWPIQSIEFLYPVVEDVPQAGGNGNVHSKE